MNPPLEPVRFGIVSSGCRIAIYEQAAISTNDVRSVAWYEGNTTGPRSHGTPTAQTGP